MIPKDLSPIITIKTVGELKRLLEQYPDDKPCRVKVKDTGPSSAVGLEIWS